MCGEYAPPNGTTDKTYNKESMVIFDTLLCDKKAKIRVHLHTDLTEHSSGFGGPPDLCPSCFLKCANELMTKIRAETRKLEIKARAFKDKGKIGV